MTRRSVPDGDVTRRFGGVAAEAEAFDFPSALFDKRVWYIPRQPADRVRLAQAAAAIRASQKPLIIAGGGVLYSEASDALAKFASATGIPVGETQAGKNSLPYDHPQCLGAIDGLVGRQAGRPAKPAQLVDRVIELRHVADPALVSGAVGDAGGGGLEADDRLGEVTD